MSYLHFETDVKFNVLARWVLESDISNRAKVVYGVLCGFADSEGKCYPSRSTIAKRAKCSIKSVDRSIKELEGISAIKVRRSKKADGSNEVNNYFLNRVEPDATVIIDATPTAPKSPTIPPEQSPKENHIKNTKGRKRDYIFEELCNQCGIDWKKSPRNELGRVQKATKQLKEINATPEEIRSVGEWYKANWKEIEITPTAIVSNYSTILRRVEEKKATQERIENPCKDGHTWIDVQEHNFRYCARCLIEEKI